MVAVLWVCGPPGVGKTAVGWGVYRQLASSGLDVGYVDIDQLGMCYPERAGDPGRHRLAAENLGVVVDGYRAAGARAVVVSGVVDPVDGVHLDRIPGVALTTCRLRADAGELARRLAARQGDAAGVAAALAEAAALDSSDVGDVCVDTSGLSVEQVIRVVRKRTAGWLDAAGTASPALAPRPAAGEGPVLWLCGPTGVGKSAVGFDLYLRHVLRLQIPGAYVDLDQIGFHGPAGTVDHRTRARILAGMWRTFRAAGARCLTVVGPAEDDKAISLYALALPEATLTVCRLHAGPDELTRRIMRRGHGGGSWAQPGDPLKGQPAAYLSAVAERAAADAAALDRAAVGDLRVDTDHRTVEEIADAIVARTGWPGPT